LKFISNENFPLASVRKLRELGYDVLSISERSPGISDLEVLRLAAEESRILLTFDGDYGELVFIRMVTAPPAVIYLRFAPMAPLEPAESVLAFISQQSSRIIGNFCVLERSLVRLRPLPSSG
jgi:predicted nuclease of predicted toxin-antitoxin system